MALRFPIGKFIILILLFISFSACVHNVPIKQDYMKKAKVIFSSNEKINTTVGLYLNENLKNYVYSTSKMGMIFKMQVGKYIDEIGNEFAKSMFTNHIVVNELPPYLGTYRPNCEFVVVPEVLNAHGDAPGLTHGTIRSFIRLRISAYDLNGDLVWQREEIGAYVSADVDYLSVLVDGFGLAGDVGFNAGVNAFTKIYDNFKESKPPALLSLVETKEKAEKIRQNEESNHSYLFNRGLDLLAKKNYLQALYCFENSSLLRPDRHLDYYNAAICQLYSGQRDRAMENFTKVRKLTNDKKWLDACDDWIMRIKNMPKIGIALVDDEKNISNSQMTDSVKEKLYKSSLLNIVSQIKCISPRTLENTEMINRCIGQFTKDEIQIALIMQPQQSEINLNIKYQLEKTVGRNKRQKKEVVEQTVTEGDIAREYHVRLNMKAYALKNNIQLIDTLIDLSTVRIPYQKFNQYADVYDGLYNKAIDRMIIALLQKDIF